MTRDDDRLFLIAGATGRTGTTSVRLLLERGYRVRAFVHRPDDRSEALAAAGAEIVAGDLLNFHDVSSAMRGVSGAYLVYPILPGLLDATVTFAQAAAEAGVRSVVNMSQISARREAASNAARQHWLAERLLDRSPMLTAHLKPTFFAEWIISGWGLHGDHGVLRLPFGTGRHAPVADVDQSYAIAAILENPGPHDRQAYPLTGPVEMDHYGIADAVSRALSIPVTYDPISIEEFAAGLASRNRSPHLIQHISKVAIDYQNGIFSGTNNLIGVIGNHTPMTVEEFVTSRKDAFQRNGPYFMPALGKLSPARLPRPPRPVSGDRVGVPAGGSGGFPETSRLWRRFIASLRLFGVIEVSVLSGFRYITRQPRKGGKLPSARRRPPASRMIFRALTRSAFRAAAIIRDPGGNLPRAARKAPPPGNHPPGTRRSSVINPRRLPPPGNHPRNTRQSSVDGDQCRGGPTYRASRSAGTRCTRPAGIAQDGGDLSGGLAGSPVITRPGRQAEMAPFFDGRALSTLGGRTKLRSTGLSRVRPAHGGWHPGRSILMATDRQSQGMSTAEKDRLPDKEFAFPKQRKEPLTDARHVRNAIARFDQVEGVSDADRDRAWKRIVAAAKRYDVEVSEASWRDLAKGGKDRKR